MKMRKWNWMETRCMVYQSGKRFQAHFHSNGVCHRSIYRTCDILSTQVMIVACQMSCSLFHFHLRVSLVIYFDDNVEMSMILWYNSKWRARSCGSVTEFNSCNSYLRTCLAIPRVVDRVKCLESTVQNIDVSNFTCKESKKISADVNT